MDTPLSIDVAALDPVDRRALEELLGCQLGSAKRVIVGLEASQRSGDGAPSDAGPDVAPALDAVQLLGAFRQLLGDAVFQHQLKAALKLLAAEKRAMPADSKKNVVPAAGPPPAQSVEDWARVYQGLSDEEVAAIDCAINTRSNLRRELP